MGVKRWDQQARSFSQVSQRSPLNPSYRPSSTRITYPGNVASTRTLSWSSFSPFPSKPLPPSPDQLPVPPSLKPEVAADVPAAPVDTTWAAESIDHQNLSSSSTSASTSASESAPTSSSSSIADLTSSSTTSTIESTQTLRDLITSNPSGNIEDVLANPDAVHAAMQVGDLKLLGLDHWMLSPIGLIQDILESVHVTAGLPWWGTIMAVTLCIRLALLPLVVRSQKNNIKLQAINPQQTLIMKKITEAKESQNTAAMQLYSQKLHHLWKEYDCSPFKALLLPLVQMPMFMSFFFALRRMSELPIPGMKEGGVAWFTDLTLCDPTYILPASSFLFTLLVFEVGADGTGQAAKNDTMVMIKHGLWLTSPIAIFVMSYMPAAILYYWACNNLLSLFIAFLINRKVVRGILKIPQPVVPKLDVTLPPERTWSKTFSDIRDIPTSVPAWWRKRLAETEAQMEKEGKYRTKAGPDRKERLAGKVMQRTEVIRENEDLPISEAEYAQSSASSSSSSSSSPIIQAASEAPAGRGFLESAGEAKKGKVLTAWEREQERQNRVSAARERRRKGN